MPADERGGMLLEVIACTVQDAVEAERGGAGRLELVRDLLSGGLTPPPALVGEVMRRVKIPVRVMIRERDDYAVGDAGELTRLQNMAGELAALGIDGVVVGFLSDGGIDGRAMEALLAAAAPARATFHHAFDALADPAAALADLRRWPAIDRVLSSGGEGSWVERAARLDRYAQAAAPGIRVLAGGGVDVDAARILARSRVAEVHAGRAARVPPTAAGAVSAGRVAALVEAARR